MHGSDRPTDMDQWMRWVEAGLAVLDGRVRGVGLVYKAGNIVTTTDGSGQASFILGGPFTSAPVVTATGGNGEQVSIVSLSLFGFTALFRDAAGTPIASGLVRCLWHALPPTP